MFLSKGKMYQNHGDILVFENSYAGNLEYVFENDLKRMLKDIKFNINFVVLASCHSENCGKVF